MHSVGCSSGTQLTKRGSSSWQRAILLKPKYNHTLWRPWQCIFGYVKCVEIRGSVHTGEIWKRRFHFESSSNVFTHTTLEIFKNGVFTLKTHQMFLPILHWRNLKTRQLPGRFWICVWGKLGQGSHVIIVTSSFSKSSVFKLTNWRQFFMRLSCYWRWISSSHCQSSCGSPRGSADYFDNVMTKFIVNNRTDSLKTDINLFFTIRNGRIARSRELTRHMNFKFMCLSAYWR